MLESRGIDHSESGRNSQLNIIRTIHITISGEATIAFAYHSLQSESMARATPANMLH